MQPALDDALLDFWDDLNDMDATIINTVGKSMPEELYPSSPDLDRRVTARFGRRGLNLKKHESMPLITLNMITNSAVRN